jgi:hypothetical protein
MRPTLPAIAVLVLALAACSREDAPQADAGAGATDATTPTDAPGTGIAPSGQARMDGFGDLDFGMTRDEARTAWTGNPLEGGADDATACQQFHPAGAGAQAQPVLMFEDDLLVRYDVSVPDITAPGGGRVGMDEAALSGLYADLRVTPHKYIPRGKVLSMHQAEDAGLPSVVAFEVDADRKVVAWRVGMPPQVDYVEGCS